MGTEERAKLVLDICSHELRTLDLDALGTLEIAIRVQIDEAVRDCLIHYNRKKSLAI